MVLAMGFCEEDRSHHLTGLFQSCRTWWYCCDREIYWFGWSVCEWEGYLHGVISFCGKLKNNLSHQLDYTPLHYASWRGHSDLASFLLSRNADVNAQGEVSFFLLCFPVNFRGRMAGHRCILQYTTRRKILFAFCLTIDAMWTWQKRLFAAFQLSRFFFTSCSAATLLFTKQCMKATWK